MENEITKNFGDTLRRVRLEKGLTQTELGKMVGLSKRMIVHYEKHIKRPPADRLMLFARVLDMPIDSLLSGKQDNLGSETDYLFARKLQKAKQLPPSDQELVASMIDTLLKKNGLQVRRPRKKKTTRSKPTKRSSGRGKSKGSA